MMRFGSGRGANHSDASWHREDLQRGHGPKGAISCAGTCEMGYSGYAVPRDLALCAPSWTGIARLPPAQVEQALLALDGADVDALVQGGHQPADALDRGRG